MHHFSDPIELLKEDALNAIAGVKTNPSLPVIVKTAERELTPPAPPSYSFPVGYHDLYPDISINSQLNRFYGGVGGDSMLTEIRAGVAGESDKVEVVQAQESLASAELDVINSIFARNVAKHNLARSIASAADSLQELLSLR